MSGIKGAPPTFDLEKLTERLKRVAAGENCGWPTGKPWEWRLMMMRKSLWNSVT